MKILTTFFTFIILTILFLFIPKKNFATHNRAGEIRIEQIDAQTVKATVTTYTKASSIMADRDTLTIHWGDGTSEIIFRSNGPDNDNNGIPDGELLPNDTKINIYCTFHTFPALGTYRIHMTDPNRNAGILNINNSNNNNGSVNIAFYIHTVYTLLNPQQQGLNSTPILLQPPIDIGCVGQPFIHNPNAFDIDGDSLSYELIVPLRDIDPLTNQPVEVPLYEFPDEIEPGPNNFWSLNSVTGDFVWNAPQKAGEYNIAMIIIEYRDGVVLDTTIRDMQILIKECDNNPPEIEVIDEICVVAGERIEFEVIATDPDLGQLVDLSVLGGPLVLEYSPAEFTVVSGYQAPPLHGVFEWQTTCEHISSQPYTIIFRSSDNHTIGQVTDSTLFLSTLKTVRITVVGPPPEDVEAEAEPEQIKVTWANPYSCEETENDLFRGFSVWRRLGSNQFDSTCMPGLAGRGYTQVSIGRIQDIDPNNPNRYIFMDTDVERGKTYCYRILAEFAKLTPNGVPYNWIQSLPSKEICIQLNRDIPLITRVSVLETDTNTGQIEIIWTKPDPIDLDTIMNPGPYRYEVFRETGMGENNMQPIPGASFVSDFFALANDTFFVDTGLNTQENAYTYKIAFYVNNEDEPLGFTTAASSVYLHIASTDEINNLSWDENTPWDNFNYIIYRKNEIGTFDSIGVSDVPFYSDEGLTNGIEYCYYVQTLGTYGLEDFNQTLINLSQEACGIPLDTIPPCPPSLTIINICDNIADIISESSFINTLIWTNPNLVCPQTDDVLQYDIYYAPVEGVDLFPLDIVNEATDTTYDHQPEVGIAGCYAITATDSVGNESPFSNIVCVDNCPLYELPNAFTPNEDGDNDLFIPFPYRFIAQIDMKIFDRWGGLVFETKDPDINWNGKNTRDKEVADGVYFYSCTVFEQRVNGIIKTTTPLSGFIHVVRN